MKTSFLFLSGSKSELVEEYEVESKREEYQEADKTPSAVLKTHLAASNTPPIGTISVSKTDNNKIISVLFLLFVNV